jgi:hypothetical protein
MASLCAAAAHPDCLADEERRLRSCVAGCRIGWMSFVVGMKAVTEAAPNRGELR